MTMTLPWGLNNVLVSVAFLFVAFMITVAAGMWNPTSDERKKWIARMAVALLWVGFVTLGILLGWLRHD
jgi:hypothetical protein